MSFLIELQNPIENPEEDVKLILAQQIKALLQQEEFSSASLYRQPNNSAVITIGKGIRTFFRDSQWSVQVKGEQLRIWVSIAEETGLNFLRAQSERMKLELMILLRHVNAKLSHEEDFFVDPMTGLLKYSFIMTWKFFRQMFKGLSGLRKIFTHMLSQMHLYAEVILFCESQAPQMKPGQDLYKQPQGIDSINRYRFLMRGTRSFRQSNLGIMDQVTELKNHLNNRPTDENAKRELYQLRVLFQNNILKYEEMRIGLEDPNPKQLANSLNHIAKAGEGQQGRSTSSSIVSGIKILQQNPLKLISKEGAHSQIKKGQFKYKLYSTINSQVIQDEKKWTDGKQNISSLVVKVCATRDSSQNSFKNQIKFLNHLRDSKSSYIGKYYLLVKKMEDRNQRDPIYMRPYSQNLYEIIKECKTFSLNQRMIIAYQISKGLCFLASQSILHRDFKPQNIMIDQALNPFIIDFGSCAPTYRNTTFRAYDLRLLTTKIFHKYHHELSDELRKKYPKEQYQRHPLFDVYSFGKVLSWIFFDSITPPTPEDLAARPYSELLQNILFIIILCLQIDPDDRPTFAEIQSFLGTLQVYLNKS